MPPRGITPRQNGQPRLIRPRTSPGFLSRTGRGMTSVQGALNPEDRAIPEEDEEEAEEEHIELLEYEWPDLPPIPCMKDAVSRKRVSQGISYLLPVDKGKNSINNWFRTDLRAMFQEPYASDNLQYDDNRVKLSAEVHFLSNTADTKWTNQHLTSIQTNLNADSEKARKLYVHSAPTGGVASRRMGIDPNKLRKRSNLFLPVKASKAQVSPEIVKLREEASQIIKQGMAYDEEGDKLSQKDHNENNGTSNGAKNGRSHHRRDTATDIQHQHHPSDTTHHFEGNASHSQHLLASRSSDNLKSTVVCSNKNNVNNDKKDKNNNLNDKTDFNRNITTLRRQRQSSRALGDSQESVNNNVMLTTYGGSFLHDSLGASELREKMENLNIQQHRFTNYEDLRNTSPPKPVIPKEFSSPYLDENENQRVWDWLHHGEVMNDFEYFLSVCG